MTDVANVPLAAEERTGLNLGFRLSGDPSAKKFAYSLAYQNPVPSEPPEPYRHFRDCMKWTSPAAILSSLLHLGEV